MSAEYGYARVSSIDQNEVRQLDALRAVGIADERIYVDHKSGKDFNRSAWRRLSRRLNAGDTLVISSVDRLGRNYTEIIEQWRRLWKADADFHPKDLARLEKVTARTINNSCKKVNDAIAGRVRQIMASHGFKWSK